MSSFMGGGSGSPDNVVVLDCARFSCDQIEAALVAVAAKLHPLIGSSPAGTLQPLGAARDRHQTQARLCLPQQCYLPCWAVALCIHLLQRALLN